MNHAIPALNLGMNKEVNYVLQGFLLTLVVVGAFKFGGLLLSIPPPPEAPKETMVGTCGNATVIMGPSEIKGKDLFLENCASCHSLFKDVLGPPLRSVEERVKDRKLLYAWIRNSDAVLKSGNPYFSKLVKDFGNVRMTPFPSLSDDDITAILDYIKAASK
jgi:mono/diheme cytochrome c family protein